MTPYNYRSTPPQNSDDQISDGVVNVPITNKMAAAGASGRTKRESLKDFFITNSRCRLPSDNSENTPIMSNNTSFAFLSSNLTNMSLQEQNGVVAQGPAMPPPHYNNNAPDNDGQMQYNGQQLIHNVYNQHRPAQELQQGTTYFHNYSNTTHGSHNNSR
eukprot:CAMPEP_0194329892 /NCGR_PEP_ID=MMETSP0171-20130528/49614_1 /TAXON_ID=218684 /ORGANISM="Corethron pennatum, Strain L29A3" /LENGTH=158 /DNA_ID=CAMNT_0039090755 /DNA_START=22 /DNA_END=498 /DNA_ORIENTATION=+